ncbi:phosphoribosyl transferase [Pandoraea morbifera]|uniref:Phosphoribosyl transferase n=1 Tax=Pandoraea morbifera TaxID=2508300 RepID=A0A5E4RHZ9_9BURK|nr:phosphoribosyltransferase family protein [Pandoraea morbifera]VVD62755.1 phosphoribosyl transferase [Pandoraea morbifera]
MQFLDRADAARQLAKALSPYADQHPLVLGVPRGGVPIAAIVAQALGGDLDVVLVRKLRSPDDEELAIGAVDESGNTFLLPDARIGDIESAYVEQERALQLETLRRRRAHLTPGRRGTRAQGRVVIVVDDGVATGASMRAALQAVRRQAPEKLVCAIPVAPREAVRELAHDADEVICLQVPLHFDAVGSFYRAFSQVGDDEVLAWLRDA